ncbi:MAG TPA: class I SAM-dependent methyltransferase [Chloroflexaceae bacterium]|nr:class I SAM-dependent methyltransferase [Chloroflexaceae bacterium]
MRGPLLALRRLAIKLLPRAIVGTVSNYKTLSLRYGQFRTIREWRCVDRDGAPLPWYTYPAIEYLKQFDMSAKRVFEYGSGYSTLFWAQRCRAVVAVESDAAWYRRIGARLPPNVTYHYRPERETYVGAIEEDPEPFDIIVIDGVHRNACARAALRKLAPDGLIILDNGDWHEQTAALLRSADLIEVDMTGFGPINPYVWTTSLFLSRQLRLVPATGRQPLHGVGALLYNEE